MNFSEEQRRAISDERPFLFLRACAGSGKTRVIVERAKRIISKGVDHEKLLLITFTRKASLEMKDRLNDNRFEVYTFHQFCYRRLNMLTDYPYKIYEETNTFSMRDILDISNYKNSINRLKKPKSYNQYQHMLNVNKRKDFDDLLIDYLNINDDIAYEHIFIDEFQDTNELQYKLLKKLAGRRTSIFAVGDPNQSIYRFRGANAKIIYRYMIDFNATVLSLSMNYRSTPQILDVANNVIRHNPKEDYLKLNAYHEQGEHVELFKFSEEYTEAQQLFDMIKTYQKNNPHSTIAVLYRNHARGYELRRLILEKDDYKLHLNDSIYLMTIHQAKGLEFDYVVMQGLEEGELPMMYDNKMEVLEEEKIVFCRNNKSQKEINDNLCYKQSFSSGFHALGVSQ